jgi:hypothetical protein
MASLSLPRVLQQRKTSLEQERENFEKCQVCLVIIMTECKVSFVYYLLMVNLLRMVYSSFIHVLKNM